MGSPLNKKRKRQRVLKLAETSMEIEEMIHSASRKLYPIMEMLVYNSSKSEHFLTKQEFADATSAANIIKEICNVLVNADFKISTKDVNFVLNKHKGPLNDQGKMYVETGLLLQLIDLYNLLEDAKDTLDEFYRFNGIHSFVQTDSNFSIYSHENFDPNRIVLRLTKPLTQSTSSSGFLPRNFIVMPSMTDEEKNDKESSAVRNEKISEITDVYGAQRVVVRCICDLQEVSKYLGTEHNDATTFYSAVNTSSSAKRKSNESCSQKSVTKGQSNLSVPKADTTGQSDSNSQKSDTIGKRVSDAQKADTPEKTVSNAQIAQTTDERDSNQKDDKSSIKETTQILTQTKGDNECCCSECLAELGSKANLKDYEDDSVIICIKGCNEDEGDVQIVIRQCPDCKNADEPTTTTLFDKSIPPDKISLLDKPDSVTKTTSLKKEDPPFEVDRTSLHSKNSGGSFVCSEDEDEQTYLPSANSPSGSIKDTGSTLLDRQESVSSIAKRQKKAADLTQSTTQQESRVECSKIRMFETTNLCFETDTGQELVISVTVTPKEFGTQKLSLRDIFSEDDYDPVSNKSGEKTFKNGQRLSIDSNSSKKSIPCLPTNSNRRKKSEQRLSIDSNSSKKSARRPSIDSNSSKKSVSIKQPDSSSYYVEERIIPLGRTKICSSVEFDVTTVPTRIREKGIQHKNAKIVVKLKDLGIDNLLRACRPAKCCRKAVLNEKMKKCLPYPPSLRSLPLDETDLDVINQSLQMNVQKVKNSTNLKKDFYANYAYSIKPIQTIMYFFVEHSNNNLNSGNKNNDVRDKLSYYINLVNDIDYSTESRFDILYFGVKETSNKNLLAEVKKKSEVITQNINDKHLVKVRKNEIIASCSKEKKAKYNKYENRPLLTSYKAEQNCSCINKNLRVIKNNRGVENESKISNQKKACVSRIPIFVGKNQTKYLNPENAYNIEEIEQEVYGISLDSLPRESRVEEENNNFSALGPKSSSSSKDQLSNKEKLDPQKGQRGCHSKSPDTSRYSVLSNHVLRKPKRKKKAFYLSRSKSDISLKILKNKCEHTAISTQTKEWSKELMKKKNDSAYVREKELSSINSNIVKTSESSNMLLSYVSKMLYKLIVKEALNENTLDNLIRNRKYEESCSNTTEQKSLYELYKRFSNKNNELFRNFEIRHFETESSHHNLKAKKSQSRIVFSSRTSKKKVCIINNLAIQTSILFGADDKQCQTSNSFIANLFKPKVKPEDRYMKKRVFKKIYNTEALSGIPNSCDQLEKFIVIFRSDHSLKSNVSDNADFLSSASEHTVRSFEHFSEQTINKSLIKLKETLERYETVKNEMAQGSIAASQVNPIEYFVYQMCSCNKFNKKPSVMQKLMNKSKGLFTSIEKDISQKYNNRGEFFSMSAADGQLLCDQCGCILSKCKDDIRTDIKPSLCQCPPDNKPNKSSHVPCCKHKNSNFRNSSNLSKITNASMASVKNLKTYFKKSVSNIKNRSREKNLGPCACDKNTSTTRSVDTEINTPAKVNVVPSSKIETSTFTTRDSTTQKCECTKCANFAIDGTCCCSHCLGCLDKSADVKPNQNNMGTLCEGLEKPVLKDSSKVKDDKAKVNGVSISSEKNCDKAVTSEEKNDVTEAGSIDKDKATMTKDKADTSILEDKKGITDAAANGTDKSEDTARNNKEDTNKDQAITTEDQIANSNILDVSNAKNKEDITTAAPTASPITSPNSTEKSSGNESVVLVESIAATTQPNEEVINLGVNNIERGGTNHDTTSYYFLTSSPNMFNQFGLGSRNPFEQYLSNFPNINVLRLNNSESYINE